jgi:hypothetical protein
MAVIVVIEGDEAKHLATNVDISPHGVRLESDATLSLGQPMGLLLATKPDCFTKARVLWS